MRIYFIRHGESEGNKERVYQPPDSPLTESGRDQAKFLSGRVARLDVDQVIASPMPRAKETAEIINKVLKKDILFSDLLIEFVRPKEVLGKKRDGEEGVKFWEEYRKHDHDPSWHYSNEENLFDIKKRAQKALSFLEEQEGENILVVTHGLFLRMLIYSMFAGEFPFSVDLYRKYQEFVLCSNTGITVCDYRDGTWKLLTWNDHSHVSEIEKP